MMVYVCLHMQVRVPHSLPLSLSLALTLNPIAGGGIVKGPLMLALGVHPAVAAATSACMIFFTSCTATFSYMVFGLLAKDYAVACLLIGFISTLVGQSVITLLMERYQRHSYIAFSIGLVIALSAFCMTAESVLAITAESSV
jgi:uncharacterized membrane protein YfcA